MSETIETPRPRPLLLLLLVLLPPGCVAPDLVGTSSEAAPLTSSAAVPTTMGPGDCATGPEFSRMTVETEYRNEQTGLPRGVHVNETSAEKGSLEFVVSGGRYEAPDPGRRLGLGTGGVSLRTNETGVRLVHAHLELHQTDGGAMRVQYPMLRIKADAPSGDYALEVCLQETRGGLSVRTTGIERFTAIARLGTPDQ